ncbi:hypothetical protein FZEAL_1760 [Fusarium zealandicum]|uniref:Transcription factor n=12 Tax=Fusarium TaxID=5506 RepID=A0A8H4US32_9HYPO|nr:hypothetical protein FZEAL_1760 [Fusarium zealandicum]
MRQPVTKRSIPEALAKEISSLTPQAHSSLTSTNSKWSRNYLPTHDPPFSTSPIITFSTPPYSKGVVLSSAQSRLLTRQKPLSISDRYVHSPSAAPPFKLLQAWLCQTCSTVRIGKVLTAQPLAYILLYHHQHDQQLPSSKRDIFHISAQPFIPLPQPAFFGKTFALPTFPKLPVTTATLAQAIVMPNTPPPALLPPPEGIFRTFDDLMASVQRVAKDQGYGIVKLRASNYRDGKPTRYDLVCDRGGVKYNSTAKKRNPSTRKIDCPFRAKAVCEVQLGNQWRFAIQEGRHNHEPRVPAGTPGQENAPLATSIRSFTNKLDRLNHDMAQGLMRIEQRLDNIEKRMENLEARAGGYEPRFQAIESRLQGMEGPRMDGMGMDDVESRLLASTVM